MDRAKELASRVCLSDVVQAPTEIKQESTFQDPSKQFNTQDFFNSPVEVDPEPEFVRQHASLSAAPIPEIEEEYDPEANARALVSTLTSVDALLLNIAVYFKARGMSGGAAAVKRMKAALVKEMAGIDLTEADKKMAGRFKEFQANYELLSGATVLLNKDRENLILLATEYCRESRFKMGTATAFWATYSGSLIERITKILFK